MMTKQEGGGLILGVVMVLWGAQPVYSSQGQGDTRISLPSITQEIKVPPGHISLGEHSMHTVSHTTMPTFSFTLITSPGTIYYDYCQSVELIRL